MVHSIQIRSRVAWSDYSDEMKSLTSIEKEQIDADIEDDGEFYMDMNDFVKVKQN